MQFNICQLLDLIKEMPSYRELVTSLALKSRGTQRALINNAAKPYLLAALHRNLDAPILLVTAQPETAKRLYEQISLWCESDEIRLLPEPDTLPFQRTIPDPSIEQERLGTLSSLVIPGNWSRPPFVIASALALVHRVTGKERFVQACHVITAGMEIEPLALMRQWQDAGYRNEVTVEVPGAASRRGDIMDVFPPASHLPIRLEFFGNTVESIRFFDPSTQRSQSPVKRVQICPASEVVIGQALNLDLAKLDRLDMSRLNGESQGSYLEEIRAIKNGDRPLNILFYAPLFNSGSLPDYLPDNAIIIMDEPGQIGEEINYVYRQTEELREQKVQAGELPPNFPMPAYSLPEIESRTGKRSTLSLMAWTSGAERGLVTLDFTPAPSYAGQLSTLITRAKDFVKIGHRVILVTSQAGRVVELFENEGLDVEVVTEVRKPPPAGSLTIIQGSLAEGWVMGATYFLTDREIFGFVKERRLLKQRAVRRHKLLVDIKPGDYVVHIEHGIGQFGGVVNMSTNTTQKEYLLLTYAAGDKLYVPTDQIDRISRYIGAGEQEPVLSRLGTQEWNRTKEKVKEAVEEIAQDLLKLYAAREVVPGHPFGPDTIWQQELEASFPYVETPDQIKVQDEVKADMTRTKPMDRLVVGDVGYGKTEIAIRAAFKAVMDNKQVAVLVPTTVLAEQHDTTFRQRMGAFPVRIEVLSRFRSPKQQKSVVQGLAEGTIDIVIGTHRLLQKDVIFKDLGLLIIDEEQRFGVSHKEHLKKLREQVDVLTLSATPIPRTLHMSLAGVRDMSLIETPPENRLPIRTYVAEYSDQLVKEAILREMERNGQVFFVHNRVQGIELIANRLKALIPQARIAVAHGQMAEEKLEQVMLAFQRGESDILVCTTIIESGLDMPNVNTLVVNRADKFGLTQLYQLRGRIGRGSNVAYAYFLYDKGARLSDTAAKRLQTIFEATELGAGFGVAMKDLEIRGAGTLLGTKQSGSISAVGFNLYTQMLAEAVAEQKAKKGGAPRETKPSPAITPTIDLPLRAFIPDDYISDIDTRLTIYQRITELNSLEQVEDLARELRDRFGAMPVELGNLLFILRLKAIASGARVQSISTNENTVTVLLQPGLQFNRQKLMPMLKHGIRIGVTQLIINLKRLGPSWQKLMEEIISRVT